METKLTAFAVSRGENGRTLQDFLSVRLGVSRRAAKNLVDRRSVWVNRACVWMAHHAVRAGDRVELLGARAAAAKAIPAVPAKAHVRVLAETGNFLVADKPAGMLSCGDAKSVEAILRAQTGIPSLEAVHRLDRDTTGCLLFAKTHAAFVAAVEVFKTRRVSKTYHAVAVGRFPFPFQTIDADLDGKPAVTRVTREAVNADASFLRIRIETGRTNQIRRHLAGMRCPVAGDRVFGLKNARDPRLMAVPRQMLHASGLELPDPVEKGSAIRAHSPLPADFRGALKLFGLGKRPKR